MSVAIIDYGSGNLRSAEKAVARCLRNRGDRRSVLVTSRPEDVAGADHIILPGVGAFGDCIGGLKALDGMVDCLEQLVIKQARPFLGICVGMQLLATRGHEHGTHKGLGWISGDIRAIEADGKQNLKIPHMGWNQIEIMPGYDRHPLFEGISGGDHVYFVHSYHFEVENQQQIMARTEYGGPLAAIIGRDNIVGTQFHPEKSQKVGLRLIENFLGWRP